MKKIINAVDQVENQMVAGYGKSLSTLYAKNWIVETLLSC